eukprot:NODE_323_length_9725_cov_0.840536.p1 type:complete len:565 gc:universal NODE_323_length_9725_cov_0.840536:7372-5678(-)
MPIPQEFMSDFKKVQSGDLSYIIYSYDKNLYLNFSDKAETFDEEDFLECFNTSKGSHAILGVQLNDLRKTILIHWLGDSAPPQLKGRFAGLVGEVESLVTCHAVMNARSEGDITYKYLESLVTKASGAKYNLANTSTVSTTSPTKPTKPDLPTRSQAPNIPQRSNIPEIPKREETSHPAVFDYRPGKFVPIVPQKSNNSVSPTKPTIPQRLSREFSSNSTTAQMIAAQKADEQNRNRSPSPPKQLYPDHRKEIEELRGQSLQAAANYFPEPETKLSESDLRKQELEQLRKKPPTTTLDFEPAQEKKLTESEIRRQELDNIKSTSSLKAKFQQMDITSSQENVSQKSASGSLNDLRSKFESKNDSYERKDYISEPTPLQPKRSMYEGAAYFTKKEENQPPLPKRENPDQDSQPMLPKREEPFQTVLPKREEIAALPTALEKDHDAVALYDYVAAESNEISFKAGDKIYNINKVDTNWWEGIVGQNVGLFPGNFVQEVGQEKPMSPVLKSKTKSIALFDYNAQESNEISFREGEIVFIVEKIDEGWSLGEINNKQGMFPISYGAFI